MIRFLNLAAICCLIGSALYAYKVKYATLLETEEAAQLSRQVDAERIAVATLRGEWQAVNAPTRLQVLADRYLDLVPLNVRHTAVSPADLPRKEADGDEIAAKLDALGLAAPTATPSSGKGGKDRTPTVRRKP
jgi:hypothetical protein